MFQSGMDPRLNDSGCTLIVLAVVALLAVIAWGFVECHYTVRVLDEARYEFLFTATPIRPTALGLPPGPGMLSVSGRT